MEGSKKPASKPVRRISSGAVLWIGAAILTLVCVILQFATGPTRPIKGSLEIGGEKIRYRLPRSHAGDGGAKMEFKAPESVGGSLFYKRYRMPDNFREDRMEYHSGSLHAELPHQPPAGKLEYYAVFRSGGSEMQVPPGRTAIIRFSGAVPPFVLGLHIVFMFAALLISMRALLETIFPAGNLKVYAFSALGALFVGGFVFGTSVQKYAFGTYWAGIPLGWDLTDNKTLIAFIAWAAACYVVAFLKKTTESKRKLAVLVASLVTVVIFLVPHSMMGSELDYSKLEPLSLSMDEKFQMRKKKQN